ncbi:MULTISPECIES: ATP-binding cassette domain-containing protein [Nocardia]|jgi:putative ABC transport system ATP-binding protein|uniref:ATP-binding cassette domain-containing protein n=1 Tax=Nocardia abscessus TaxID=120957 RepID=UPI0018937238|nr:ATP-binding cassette domain-containing protein [Nocardia abscessus]MBF6471882.1 ATP-binding cassette domain-containing protein [Nocardia abscessus]
MSAIEVEKLTKFFAERVILDKLSFQVETATMLAITGASGSGKTTLLNCIGLLDDYDSGEITVNGTKLTGIRRRDRVRYFRYQVGYLFQNYALIDDKTVAENLSVACTYASRELGSKRDWQLEALEQVGLRDKLTARVFELSGGEQQRVAVARLLIKRPRVILADEPTGALDPGNRDEIMGHLEKLRETGSTVLVVTHDPHVVDHCDDHMKL